MNKQKTLIFSLSAILFLALSFIVYSWNEPVANMPSGYTAPLNTSATAQNKVGELGAASFVDADDSDYYINPSGNSVVSGKIVMENSTASTDIPTTIATKGYVDTEIARVESLVNGSLPLVYNMHTRQSCTDAGGTVVDSDVSLPMCKFNAATCPTNWTQYKNFSTTVANGIVSCTNCDTSCYSCTATYYPGGAMTRWSASCNPGYHSWGNIGHESCIVNCPYANTVCNSKWTYSGSAASLITQIGCY